MSVLSGFVGVGSVVVRCVSGCARVVTGTTDGSANTLALWQLTQHEEDLVPRLLASLNSHSPLTALHLLSQRPPHLLTATVDGTIVHLQLPDEYSESSQIRERTSWAQLHRGPVTGLDYHQEKQEIISAGEDGVVNLFGISDANPRQQIGRTAKDWTET